MREIAAIQADRRLLESELDWQKKGVKDPRKRVEIVSATAANSPADLNRKEITRIRARCCRKKTWRS